MAHSLNGQPSDPQGSARGRRSRKRDFFPDQGCFLTVWHASRARELPLGDALGSLLWGGALHCVTPGIRDLPRGCSSLWRPPH